MLVEPCSFERLFKINTNAQLSAQIRELVSLRSKHNLLAMQYQHDHLLQETKLGL